MHEEAFSNVFGSGNLVYVVAVSLGNEIADDDYSGEVEPDRKSTRLNSSHRT